MYTNERHLDSRYFIVSAVRGNVFATFLELNSL